MAETILIVNTLALILILMVIVINVVHYRKENKRLEKLRKERKITSDNLLETHKHNNKTSLIQITSLIFTGILIIATVSTTYISTNTNIQIAEEQINLLKQTTSPNWAHLDISFGEPYEKRIMVDANELVAPKEKITDRKSLYILIINSGKVNTGNLRNIGYYSKDKYIHTTLNGNKPLNISPQSGIKEIVYLTTKLTTEDDFNVSELPHKEYNLTLKLSCDFCEPDQREIEEIIPLCIYHNSEDYNYCSENYWKF